MVLDHVYGKPSTTWKRIEAILLTLISYFYSLFTCYGQLYTHHIISGGGYNRIKILKTYHNHVPPGGKHLRRLNQLLSKYAPWQIVLGTLTSCYLLSKFSLLTFMNASEQYAQYYNKNFYRATWILTALDAGFWSTMHMKPKCLRDTCSILMSLVYFVFADKATHKTRSIGAAPTVQNLRVSWNKRCHPVLNLICRASQPKIGIRGQSIYIPRTKNAFGFDSSKPDTTQTRVVLYYKGTQSEFHLIETVILHFPGGGFVCMSPEAHEDYLVEWAFRSPYTLIVAVDYGKAPENPYPFAHHELFDLYALIRETNGKCLGLAGWYYDLVTETITSGSPKIEVKSTRIPRDAIRLTLSGDSAGGNLAVGVVSRAIEKDILLPDALLLAYPHLNFDLACWLTPQQLTLLRVESAKNLNAHLDIHRTASQTHMQTSTFLPLTPLRTSALIRSNSDLGMKKPMNGVSELHIEDEQSLSRTQSLFGIAATKLSALRTQKPVSVFDDYGNPSTVHDMAPILSRANTPSDYNPMSDSPAKPSPRSIKQSKSSEYRSNVPDRKLNTDGPSSSLTMTSIMSYFSDRILSPETMRACGLLYMAPSSVPIDLKNDYYLCPSRTPFHILAKFPKTYMVCGEKDPLVDDTILFAGRLRESKRRSNYKQESGVYSNDAEVCEVVIMEGVSHAVLQIMGILPEGRDCVHLLHAWMYESLFLRCKQINDEYYDESVQSTPVSRPRYMQHESAHLGKSIFSIGPCDHAGSKSMSDTSSDDLSINEKSSESLHWNDSVSTKVQLPQISTFAHSKKQVNVPSCITKHDIDTELQNKSSDSRVTEHMVLTRRQMQITQGLFTDNEQQKQQSRGLSATRKSESIDTFLNVTSTSVNETMTKSDSF